MKGVIEEEVTGDDSWGLLLTSVVFLELSTETPHERAILLVRRRTKHTIRCPTRSLNFESIHGGTLKLVRYFF